jgi:hypothetical protein
MDKQILWNIVNSLLGGGLVLLGECADGEVSQKGLIIASVAGLTVAFVQFKDFWQTEKKTFKRNNVFNFIKL